MIFRKSSALLGPNVWASTPVLETWVDLAPLAGVTASQIARLDEQFTAWLPAVAGSLADAKIDGAAIAGRAPTNGHRHHHSPQPVAKLARRLAIVCLELQKLVSAPASWTWACEPRGDDVFCLAVACEEEVVARAAIEAARRICQAALDAQQLEAPQLEAQPLDVQAVIEELRAVADRVCLGPSTRAIVRAARGRGIPVRRLNTGSFVQLGHGRNQRRVRTAETDRTGAVAEAIASDKELTKQLLAAVGVPVPAGRAVENAGDAWEVAQDIGVPVVVKPRDGNHGRGVFTGLTSREQVESAYAHAAEEGDGVIVERFAPGAEHRLLVVDGKFVAGTRGDPAVVTGDGASTIRQLVDTQLNSDPRRGDTDDCPLAPVSFDSVAQLLLEQRGYTPDSIPPAGEQLVIQYNGNLAIDVTDEVHPEVAARVVDAARVVGLDVAGIDVVACDISRPLEEQGGVIVEVNAGPGLHMHLYPSVGKPRPVGEAIVASLYPEDPAGRIPLVGVLDSQPARHTTHAVAEVLAAGNVATGLACSEGIFLGGRRLSGPAADERQSADLLLANPRVAAAVVGTAAANVIGNGLPVDALSVTVLTEECVSSDDSLAAGVMARTLGEQGTAIVDAAHASMLRGHREASSLVVLATRENDPLLAAHRKAGHRAVFVRENAIVASHDGEETLLASLTRLPTVARRRDGVRLESLLAAAACGWVLGQSPRAIRTGLEAFARTRTDRRSTKLPLPAVVAAEGEPDSSVEDPKAA
ncbi:MAG TPA: acetate--CoA ligase family protein [Pirellulales bacterium]|jgi:cyanophycin synthetase|nr:acetate--CoA ligase family protein [Pirellulales bacterium]